jgi:hypothetical protein
MKMKKIYANTAPDHFIPAKLIPSSNAVVLNPVYRRLAMHISDDFIAQNVQSKQLKNNRGCCV